MATVSWASVGLLDEPAPEVDCSLLEAPTLGEAFDLAANCDADVLVRESLTSYDTQWATPRMTVLEESSMGAVRAPRDDVPEVPASEMTVADLWRPIDATVVTDPDTGDLAVASGVADVAMKGSAEAGESFMVVGVGAEAIEVSVPFELGDAVVDGSQVTWPVLDGSGAAVDGAVVAATVRSDTTVVTPALRVDDSRALRALRAAAGEDDLAIEVDLGRDLETDQSVPGDTVAAVTDAGEPRFSVTALQWDGEGAEGLVTGSVASSSSGETVDHEAMRLAQPLPGDRTLAADVQVASNSLSVAPEMDQAIAQAPVVTAIALANESLGGTRNEWTAIKTGWKDSSSSFKFSSTEAVGLCDADDAYGVNCERDNTQRLIWEFTGLKALGSMDPADVVSASFRAFGTHSYNCVDRTVEVYSTPPIDSTTNWNNYASRWGAYGLGAVDQRTVSHKSTCSSTQWVEFDVTRAAKDRASANAMTIDIGMKAITESSMIAWKRYRYDAKFVFEYNRAPNKPYDASITVGGSDDDCNSGADRSRISDTTPTLSVRVSDPDSGNVRAKFQVWKLDESGVWGPSTTVAQADGQRHAVTVPSGRLVNGVSYRWRAWAVDPQGRQSSGNIMCEFTVDTAAPPVPKIAPVTSEWSIKAIYEKDRARGGAGMRGCFKITLTGATDFQYGYNDSAMPLKGKVDSAGTAFTCTTPEAAESATTVGTNYLRVRAIDPAGNLSPSATHRFIVATPVEDVIYPMDEHSDSATANTGPVRAGELVWAGSSGVAQRWVTGPLTAFESRDLDTALAFNGVDDFAATDQPVVDTTDSFAVSAFVRLDDTTTTSVAVSQDGLLTSAFKLGYRSDCGSGGCWDFWMPRSDIDAPSSALTVSDMPVVAGDWFHLVGEYDKGAGSMSLWVCQIGTPQDPGDGIPDETTAAAHTTPWQAGGQFVVGRSLHRGVDRDQWNGAIDNVRVFSGEVVATSKIRRMCQGAEAADLVDNLDPTVPVVTEEGQ